ncbi:MAG: N-acetylglucosamine-6-phosphate deacetylase [Myxococcota bacterium]|nr:N-acetylglucosamine-6-phosphate deacetylase [Myxococcota bacterium]
MEKIALTEARLVDPEGGEPGPGTLLLEGDRILDRLPAGAEIGEDFRRVPKPGRFLAPGFIDLHFHGELVVSPPEAFGDCLARAARNMAGEGTTAFLATTLAWSEEALPPRVGALADLVDAGGREGAACLGLHLEGPWLSPQSPGAMSLECIRPFQARRDAAVLDRAGSRLRMVTLAPEVEGASALLAELVSRDVLAAIGHTRATAETLSEAVSRGARHATHLFNAMGPIHHREPGVAAEIMAHEALHCDLICDGHHVHPTMVGLAARMLGERLVLITDRVDYEVPGSAEREPGAPIRLPDGTLAGSQLGLDRAVRLARRHAALSLRDAVAACTVRPARLLGIEAERGTLRPGARADLALLEGEGSVAETWIGGRPFEG